MPYDANNVSSLPANVRKLSPKKRRQWTAVWNSAYRSCISGGGETAHCEGSAFAQANGTVSKKADDDDPTSGGQSMPIKRSAVKFTEGADDLIEGLAAPFGGVFNGKDIQGEFFSANTDFVLDWFEEIPLLYQHGLDDDLQVTVVGRVKTRSLTDTGAWAQAQLDKKNEYFEAIKDLIDQKALFFSSGAMAHLVKAKTSGEIVRWPWVELSLTPTPANILAHVDSLKAVKHFEDAGLALPDLNDLAEGIPGDDEPKAAKAGVKQDATTGMSYEERRQQIEAMLNPRPIGYPDARNSAYVNIIETYDDHVIVRRYSYDDGDESYWEVPYTIDENLGMIVLGDPVEVEQTYVPIQQRAAGMRALAGWTLDAIQAVAAVQSEAEALADRRAKAGRQLSASNRKRLEDLLAAMDSSVVSIRSLLDAMSPQADTVKTDDAARRRYLDLSTRLLQHRVA